MIRAYCVKSPSGELFYMSLKDLESRAQFWADMNNLDRGEGHTVVPVTIHEGDEHPAVAILREVYKVVAHFTPADALEFIHDRIEELSK